MRHEDLARRYLNIKRKHEHPNTPEPERKVCETILTKMRSQYPGIELVAEQLERSDERPDTIKAEEARREWEAFRDAFKAEHLGGVGADASPSLLQRLGAAALGWVDMQFTASNIERLMAQVGFEAFLGHAEAIIQETIEDEDGSDEDEEDDDSGEIALDVFRDEETEEMILELRFPPGTEWAWNDRKIRAQLVKDLTLEVKALLVDEEDED